MIMRFSFMPDLNRKVRKKPSRSNVPEVHGPKEEMTSLKNALLIIDVQNDYFEGGKSELYNSYKALMNIEKVLKLFRESGQPVIHVQHINTRSGATFFLPDTAGVLIHKNLTPLDHETLIVKHAPSSFLNTNLSSVLQEKGISELVICGMMSHMCVDTTTRACMDFGLKVTLLEDACATKDLIYNKQTIPAETVHNVFMASLDGLFARVIKTDEFIN